MIWAGDDSQNRLAGLRPGHNNRLVDQLRRDVEQLRRFECAVLFGGGLEGGIFYFFGIQQAGDVVDGHGPIIKIIAGVGYNFSNIN